MQGVSVREFFLQSSSCVVSLPVYLCLDHSCLCTSLLIQLILVNGPKHPCIVTVALSLKTSELLTGDGERWKRNEKGREEEEGGRRKREKVQGGERKQRREKKEREGGEEERRETMVISHC